MPDFGSATTTILNILLGESPFLIFVTAVCIAGGFISWAVWRRRRITGRSIVFFLIAFPFLLLSLRTFYLWSHSYAVGRGYGWVSGDGGLNVILDYGSLRYAWGYEFHDRDAFWGYRPHSRWPATRSAISELGRFEDTTASDYRFVVFPIWLVPVTSGFLSLLFLWGAFRTSKPGGNGFPISPSSGRPPDQPSAVP